MEFGYNLWSIVNDSNSTGSVFFSVILNWEYFFTHKNWRELFPKTFFFFKIQTQHSDNLGVLVMTAMEVFYSFGVLFMSCEIGQRLNVAFDECGRKVELLVWYLFPTKVQRMVPLIMNFTQQPIEITCFGSTACGRETFKYVRIKANDQFDMQFDDLFLWIWKLMRNFEFIHCR